MASSDVEVDYISQIKADDIDKTKLTNGQFATLLETFPLADVTNLALYLEHYNYDIAKVKRVYAQAEAWKEQSHPILKSECSTEIDTGKFIVRGVDKEGRPLLIFRSRFHDRRHRDLEEMNKMVLWWAEHIKAVMPENKSKCVMVLDRTDATSYSQDQEFFKPFVQNFAKLYPGGIARTIVYPSGLLFYSLWSVIKWFIDPKQRESTVICVYFSGVQEYISDDNIPASMGGNCQYVFDTTDYPDPYHTELITATLAKRAAAPPVPKGSLFAPLMDKEEAN